MTTTYRVAAHIPDHGHDPERTERFGTFAEAMAAAVALRRSDDPRPVVTVSDNATGRLLARCDDTGWDMAPPDDDAWHATIAPSHRHRDGWDLDALTPDGRRCTYTLIPTSDRRAWWVVSANAAGWTCADLMARAGILEALPGGPGTYGHVDFEASADIADAIREASTPATR